MKNYFSAWLSESSKMWSCLMKPLPISSDFLFQNLSRPYSKHTSYSILFSFSLIRPSFQKTHTLLPINVLFILQNSGPATSPSSDPALIAKGAADQT